jgi:hypothetical protein
VESFSIGSGVGGARNLSGEGSEGSVAGIGGVGTVNSKRDDVEGVPEGDGVVGDDIVSGIGSVGGDGDVDGGMQEMGESCSFSSLPPPLNCSTSHLSFTAFLVRFAGGEEAVWDGSFWGTDVGAGGASSNGGAGITERDLLSAVSPGVSVLALTASLATKLRRRWQQRHCLAAGARIEEGADEREQVWETMCHPAAWRAVTQI